MRTTGLGESAFRRVAVIAGATAAVTIALLVFKPFSIANDLKAANSVDVRQRVDQERKIEPVSFVTSPVIDSNPRFFFGTGDGSNGYYAERPQPR